MRSVRYKPEAQAWCLTKSLACASGLCDGAATSIQLNGLFPVLVQAGEIGFDLVEGRHDLFHFAAVAEDFGIAEVGFKRLRLIFFLCDLSLDVGDLTVRILSLATLFCRANGVTVRW